jgi:hypothetical protein
MSTCTSDHGPDYGPAALAARAEITDVILRYCHATDRRQWWLMDTVFHEDATCHLSVIGGSWRKFVEQAEALLQPVGVTHHQVGNIQIALEGDVAHAETYATAFHRVPADAAPGGPFGGTGEAYDALVGLRYIDRHERRGGVWRIAERRTAATFRHYQPVNEGGLANIPVESLGQWGDADVSLPVVAAWRGQQPPQEAYTLDELSARAEIADVVHLYCHAVDRHRWELMDAAFHPDATSRFLDATRTVPEFVQSGRNLLGPLTDTHHQTGNMLITLDGDQAWAETYVTAFHAVPTTAPRGTFWGGRDEPYEGVAGGRYVDRLERRDGAWRIAHRTVVYDWDRFDAVGERPEGLPEATFAENANHGCRSTEDFSYRRLGC